jgi:hypothetical protein
VAAEEINSHLRAGDGSKHESTHIVHANKCTASNAVTTTGETGAVADANAKPPAHTPDSNKAAAKNWPLRLPEWPAMTIAAVAP